MTVAKRVIERDGNRPILRLNMVTLKTMKYEMLPVRYRGKLPQQVGDPNLYIDDLFYFNTQRPSVAIDEEDPRATRLRLRNHFRPHVIRDARAKDDPIAFQKLMNFEMLHWNGTDRETVLYANDIKRYNHHTPLAKLKNIHDVRNSYPEITDIEIMDLLEEVGLFDV